MEANASNAILEAVRSNWEMLLQNRDFSDEDDFFVLGGDSMLGMTMLMSLTECTGIEFTLDDLYENPTLARLTALISERKGR